MGFLQEITAGGQTWAHRLRMFRQVIKIAMTVSTIIGIASFLLLMTFVPFHYYQGAWYNLKAKILSSFSDRVNVDKDFWEKVSRERKNASEVPVSKVIFHTAFYRDAFDSKTLENAQKASLFSSILCGSLLGYFLIRGKLTKKKKHISGKKIASAWLVSSRLRLTRKASPIVIGSVPLVKGTENQHMLITGGTGSGKTNCLFHLLDQIRNQGQKAIVVDSTGSFIKQFYRKGKDILLNPFDPDGACWHPWIECQNRFDYEALAESFIPHTYSEHENYWRQASRSLFSSVLQKLNDSEKTSEMVRWLLFEPLPKLCKFVENTKAAAHMDPNSEKTSSSIRSVTSSFIECLENLKDTENPFSINQWLKNGNSDSWLFIHCTTAQRAAVTPLISTWISVAIRALLNLPQDLDRRLWFILDELPSLQKIKDLETLLTEGRKYGGCGVLALQSLAQLDNIYGRESTKTIIGNAATKLIFSEQDPEVSARISKMLGEHEIKEYQEGLSYGAHEVRDGVSLSQQTRQLPIVSPTDIQSLEKNTAFIRLPGPYPIVKVKVDLFKTQI